MFKIVEQEQATYLKFKPWEELGCSAIFSLKMRETAAANASLYKSLNIDKSRVVQLKQVHSRNLFILKNRESYQKQELFRADAVISSRGRISSLPEYSADDQLAGGNSAVLQGVFADCVPVYFCEPREKILALAHAGWRGTGKRICSSVLRELTLRYGIEPEDCQIIIGPAIGMRNYQVGSEVFRFFSNYWDDPRNFFQDDSRSCGAEKQEKPGKYYLDLKEANRQDLLKAGAKEENIYLSPRDTFKDSEMFYSYRREGNQALRMKALLFWEESKQD